MKKVVGYLFALAIVCGIVFAQYNWSIKETFPMASLELMFLFLALPSLLLFFSFLADIRTAIQEWRLSKLTHFRAVVFFTEKGWVVMEGTAQWSCYRGEGSDAYNWAQGLTRNFTGNFSKASEWAIGTEFDLEVVWEGENAGRYTVIPVWVADSLAKHEKAKVDFADSLDIKHWTPPCNHPEVNI